MKLEVGKEYVDGHGVVYKMLNEVNGKFFGCDGKKFCEIFYLDGNQQWGECSEDNLVKEYILPRTKDVWVVMFDNGEDVICRCSRVDKASWHKATGKVISKRKITMTEGEFE